MRLKAFLVTLLAGTAFLVAGPASPASAIDGEYCHFFPNGGSGSVRYITPYASTGYGPVSHGIEVSGTQARAGFYSPLTLGFSASTGWVSYTSLTWTEYKNVVSSDGFSGYTNYACVWGKLNTPYGLVGYGAQFAFFGSFGPSVRWGNFNFSATSPTNPRGTFYPDGSGWMSVT